MSRSIDSAGEIRDELVKRTACALSTLMRIKNVRFEESCCEAFAAGLVSTYDARRLFALAYMPADGDTIARLIFFGDRIFDVGAATYAVQAFLRAGAHRDMPEKAVVDLAVDVVDRLRAAAGRRLYWPEPARIDEAAAWHVGEGRAVDPAMVADALGPLMTVVPD